MTNRHLAALVGVSALVFACGGNAAAPPPQPGGMPPAATTTTTAAAAVTPCASPAPAASASPASPASAEVPTAAPTPSPPAAVHDVPVGAITLHVEEWGSGTPLVLLHNFGWSGKVFAPFIPELSRDHRVLVVDLPGMGASTGWNVDRYDHAKAATQVLGALSQLGVTTLQGVGVSSGSIILLEMAVQQPDRVDRMVLSGTGPGIPPEARAWVAKNGCTPSSPEDVKKELEFAAHGEEQVRALDRLFCREKDDTLQVTPQQLATVKARTLVAQGEQDKIFPVAQAIRVYQGIKDAHLWVQPGGGHTFLLRDPYRAEVLHELRAFLAGELDTH
jgi:pimeloyl-ACP methyl ester carboxylesterase